MWNIDLRFRYLGEREDYMPTLISTDEHHGEILFKSWLRTHRQDYVQEYLNWESFECFPLLSEQQRPSVSGFYSPRKSHPPTWYLFPDKQPAVVTRWTPMSLVIGMKTTYWNESTQTFTTVWWQLLLFNLILQSQPSMFEASVVRTYQQWDLCGNTV